jgi:rhamnogalacturonan endolyase
MKSLPLRAAFFLLVTALLGCAALARASDSLPPVRTADDGQQITLNNGIVFLSISKRSGSVSSIKLLDGQHPIELGNGRTAAMYFDVNSTGGYTHPVDPALIRIAASSPQQAEVVVGSKGSKSCPFDTAVHYILRTGDSGFYVYINFKHDSNTPAAGLGQARMVLRARSGTSLFTNYLIDDARTGPIPSGPVVATVQDTTWKYADGQIRTKYDYSNFIGDDLVHGMAGRNSAGTGIGLWLIQPSREYVNGGPLRQELTVHQGPEAHGPQQNILLWMFQGGHYGGSGIRLAAGQEWSRLYGPAMVYVNRADSIANLWADAKTKARAEQAAWPYSFVRDADYPLLRGRLRGTVRLADGENPANAWVVLAPAGEKDWCQSASGYEFWSRADAAGHFVIDKIRPGRYCLFISGANQFVDFRRDDIQISAGQSTDLGSILWQPVLHGQTLWQIGIADRSGREFRDGDNVRHYDNFIRYATTFPNDVVFTIGKSNPATDWNFAQWGWYMKRPYWTIRFDEPESQPLHCTATLTLGFLAWDYPRALRVTLNDHVIGTVKLRKSGSAIYRSGGQDSLYQVATLPFNAALIKSGSNEMHLALIGAVPFADPTDAHPGHIGGVMYDAIRLELNPNAPPPPMGAIATSSPSSE